MSAITFNNSFSNVRAQDPDSYAKTYADKNGITLEEAKAELKSKYGDPSQSASPSIFGFNQNTETASELDFSDIDISGFECENPFGNFFKNIASLFKGGDGPQNEGDPQPHLGENGEQQSGPVNEGDPQPHLNNADGPVNEGDPEFHLANNFFGMGIEAQTKQDPDEFAKAYADEKGITLEEAKAELEALYGAPTME